MMFAPDPSKTNFYITAIAEFDDGTWDQYTFPRGTELTIVQKYVNGEKYRKIITEAIGRDKNQFMWKDVARFALRKMKNSNFRKIPVKVHLTRHWNFIPNIKTKFIPHSEIASNYQSYRFFTYEVI